MSPGYGTPETRLSTLSALPTAETIYARFRVTNSVAADFSSSTASLVYRFFELVIIGIGENFKMHAVFYTCLCVCVCGEENSRNLWVTAVHQIFWFDGIRMNRWSDHVLSTATHNRGPQRGADFGLSGLGVVRKEISWNFESCPEIYSMSWISGRCPEFFLNSPVNGASVHRYTNIYVNQLQGVDAPAHVSLRPTMCTLKTENHSRTVTLMKVWNKQRTCITGFG